AVWHCAAIRRQLECAALAEPQDPRRRQRAGGAGAFDSVFLAIVHDRFLPPGSCKIPRWLFVARASGHPWLHSSTTACSELALRFSEFWLLLCFALSCEVQCRRSARCPQNS